MEGHQVSRWCATFFLWVPSQGRQLFKYSTNSVMLRPCLLYSGLSHHQLARISQLLVVGVPQLAGDVSARCQPCQARVSGAADVDDAWKGASYKLHVNYAHAHACMDSLQALVHASTNSITLTHASMRTAYPRQVLRNDDNFRLPKFIRAADGRRIFLAVNTMMNEFGEIVGRWLKPDASHASIFEALKKLAARYSDLEQVDYYL